MNQPLLSTLSIALGVALGACTGYGPGDLRTGQTVEEVARSLGAPTGRYPLAQGGTRLEYARGPYGKHTFMVDIDATGRVAAWQQVLTERHFATIAPGIGTDELLRTLGRPSDRRSGGWQGGEVWSYRYDAIFCQWFQVSVIGGRVRDAAYGPDPLCDVNDADEPQ
jgi:hypothetical protein